MEFFKYKNKLKPEKGRLLISEPFLPDPNFERTVVLLCEHNDDGSFGFVINKPSILKVNDVIEDIRVVEDIVFIGGPVQQDTFIFCIGTHLWRMLLKYKRVFSGAVHSKV